MTILLAVSAFHSMSYHVELGFHTIGFDIPKRDARPALHPKPPFSNATCHSTAVAFYILGLISTTRRVKKARRKRKVLSTVVLLRDPSPPHSNRARIGSPTPDCTTAVPHRTRRNSSRRLSIIHAQEMQQHADEIQSEASSPSQGRRERKPRTSLACQRCKSRKQKVGWVRRPIVSTEPV